MTDKDRNREIVRLVIERGINEGDFAVADDRFTDDYEVHAPGLPPLPKGAGAFKKAIGLWRTAFSDMHMEILDLIAEGDRVVNRFKTTGTHDGPLMGYAPTGRPVTVYGMECHRLVDGLVAESWIGDDVPTILKQIGALVERDPTGGRTEQ